MFFLPFLRWRGLSLKIILLYMLVAAFQLGIMYLFVFQAYNDLIVVGFLLFTVLTPLDRGCRKSSCYRLRSALFVLNADFL